MNTRGTSFSFRPDIEGLRAIAILLVVAAHANVPWLAGGFVGVDVFFVLSGYLITRLLVQEMQSTQNFRFASFYARRFLRLLPGLLLMLACTCMLGYLLVAPSEQSEQAMAGASAALWLSNFHFAFSNLGYFDPTAEANLFLHTWSLGVEEQFYVVWPTFLMLALGVWKGAAQAPNTRRLALALLLVFCTSFLACVFLTVSHSHFAFYMMPTRAWQFALGALAFLYIDDGSQAVPVNAAKPCSAFIFWGGWLGLSLIVAAALAFSATTPYPGLAALLPSVGAAILLATGTRLPHVGISRVLSFRPLQMIGRVSYSWYLWHWPVFLLSAMLINVDHTLNRLALVVLSFILATVSYQLVESPIRRNPALLARPRLAVLSALVLTVIANALAICWSNAALDSLKRSEQLRFAAAASTTSDIYRMGCDDWYHSSDVRVCAFGSENADHTAVAIGDSVGLQWFPAMAEIFNRPGWRLLVMTKSSCPMVDEPFFYPRIGREYTECAKWRQTALAQVTAIKPQVVILGSTFTYNFTQAQWINGTTRVLQSISDAAGHIYVLRSTPVLPFDGPSCLAPRSWLYEVLSSADRCTAPSSNARADAVYGWLQKSAGSFKNVSLIDMTDVVCPERLCRAELDGSIVFRDSQHLSTTFAASLSKVLAKRLNM